MKILQILDKKSEAGGGLVTHVGQLSRALEQHGHSVDTLRLLDGADNSSAAGNHDEYILPYSYGQISGMRMDATLQELLERIHPQIIHIHGCFTTLSPVLFRRLNRHAPVVGTLHDIRPFCYLMSRRFGPGGELCHRTCGAGCFTSGCVRPRSPVDMVRLLRRWYVDHLRLEQWRHMDRVIVPSAYMQDLALQHGFTEKQLRRVPHGTIMPAGQPSHRDQESVPLILFIGTLIDYKGADLLVDALAQLKNHSWDAVLIGDGPDRSSVANAVSQYGLEHRVQFHGQVADRKIINDFLTRATLLVLPSTIPESFALVGIEALACGTPVVSFGLGGVREWLTDDVTGLIAKDGDSTDLARQITKLLDNPDLAREMGIHGQTIVAENFNFSDSASQTCTIYDELSVQSQYSSQSAK